MKISRRTFLYLSGLTTLSTATGCVPWRRNPTSNPLASAPQAVAAMINPDVEIRLTAKTVEWELAPGKVITAWSYNGSVPGETIRVKEGDQVRVLFQNKLPEPTTIHWHGIDVPNVMDGVPDLTQPAVQPDQQFVYEFAARPAGTRWYHTHFNSVQQQDLGLSAPFIIEPATETPSDREYTLVLDDWLIDQTSTSSSDNQGMMGGGMGNMMDGGAMNGMMGGTGPAYDTFTINGKAHPATEPLTVKQGERVRLRLINVSNNQTFVIGLVGHRLQVTHTDGNPLQAPVAVDAVPIAPAERYDVTFVADNPGRWPLYALDPGHTAGGLKTLVVYKGFESATAAQIPGATNKLRIWSYPMGQGIDLLPSSSGRRRSYNLTLSGGMMMNPDHWTINGKVYPNTPQIQASRDQLVTLRLSNMSMEAHPFHLHGQSFRILRVNGRTLSAPLIKDVVDISAHMGSVDLAFVAFNPGDWLFHCHKPMHMDGGMSMLVRVA
ncbi:MAG TPA: multicopper oxidase family protein [Caldilineaceae bacterium]|nr:multicopper oxidase family protein [Caldilineaceae bacterium]